MNKYHVTLTERIRGEEQNIYEVIADSEEEAIEIAENGDGKLIDSSIVYSDIIESELDNCNLVQKMV